MNEKEAFKRFVDIIKALRHPEKGCPWDLEQTHESLRPYLLEEAYEVLDSIDDKNDEEFCGELGDLLLQIVLHAQLASERKAFAIEDVVERISEKMIRRHPHVFASVEVSGAKEVLKNWERIKQEEQQEKEQLHGEDLSSHMENSTLSGVSRSMPALLKASLLGTRAAKVNFDWSRLEDVWGKVNEELSELGTHLQVFPEDTSQKKTTDDIPQETLAGIKHELGDILFALVQVSRWLGISAEDSLDACCTRFTQRFAEMEKLTQQPFSELSEEELETLWQRAKKKLRKQKGPP